MLLDNIRESFGTLDIDHGIDSESTPEEIETLQKYLMFLDYDLPRFGADGDYGGETISAIEAYQQDNGLEVTGIADPATLQHMQHAFDNIQNNIAAVEAQIRAEILRSAGSYVGTMEVGGDNQSPIIAEFLRSDEYSRNNGGSGSAPLGSAWCAGFASHILSNISPHIAEYNVLAKGMMREFDNQGAFYEVGSDYTPQPGDMIFFERGADGDWRGHVGFVKEVLPDGSIVTIEGNKHHPDFADEDSYGYDPDRPDGVREVTYSPEEFEQERILGFGNTMEMYALNVGLENVVGVAPEQNFSPAPQSAPVPPPRIDF